MNRLFTNDAGRTGWLDHLLSTLGGCFALYSVGVGITRPDVGTLFIGIYLIGKAVSWLFGSLAADRRIVMWDGGFYAMLVLVLGLSFSSLNAQLSDNPFVGIFTSVGFLCWMLIFGAFVSWRDGTILFQAVPCIAVFGLVGCYDTFRSVTYFFFGFLLCVATLFARINARNMLDYAVRSGAPIARNSAGESALAALRRGPWRSVAGPAWALMSAGVIVLLSFLGAPLVQASVHNVVGHVRFPLPRNLSRLNLIESYFHSEQGSVRVGEGPVTLSAEPVMRIQLDHPRYLRSVIYHDYDGRGWTGFVRSPRLPQREREAIKQMTVRSKQEIRDPQTIEFTIEMLSSRGEVVPAPGEVERSRSDEYFTNDDGTYTLPSGRQLNIPAHGHTVVSADNAPDSKEAQRDIPEDALAIYTSRENIPPDVSALARQVSRGASNDRERANKIKDEIGRRIVYDQSAGPTPDNWDPVSYALFQSNTGYCDLFASSMVLMARAVNIPARYVIGFYPFDSTRDAAGRYTVREKDAHAWAELYFKGAGWVVFDATEGAVEADGGSRKDDTLGLDWYRTKWFKWLSRGATAAIFASIPILLVRWRRHVGARNPRLERLARSYSQFNSALQRLSGRTRMPEETPEEYLAAIGPSLAGAIDDAESLTRDFLRLLFGPISPTDQELAAISARVRELRRMPKSSQ